MSVYVLPFLTVHLQFILVKSRDSLNLCYMVLFLTITSIKSLILLVLLISVSLVSVILIILGFQFDSQFPLTAKLKSLEALRMQCSTVGFLRHSYVGLSSVL